MKITVQSDDPATDFDGLEAALTDALGPIGLRIADTHAILTLPTDKRDAALDLLKTRGLRIMGVGADDDGNPSPLHLLQHV